MNSMMRGYFFTRKQIWLPTWQFLSVIILLTLGVSYIVLHNVAYYLSKQSPVVGNYLVIEGWLNSNGLISAANEYHKTQYEYVITTGGIDKSLDEPITYATSAAKKLIDLGIPKNKVITADTPESAQDRTYLSAVIVREKLKTLNLPYKNMNIFSGGVHARRTHYLYQSAFREESIDIGILRAIPDSYELSAWWQTSQGAKTVLTELIAWIWTITLFNSTEIGSHQERWGINKQRQVDHST